MIRTATRTTVEIVGEAVQLKNSKTIPQINSGTRTSFPVAITSPCYFGRIGSRYSAANITVQAPLRQLHPSPEGLTPRLAVPSLQCYSVSRDKQSERGTGSARNPSLTNLCGLALSVIALPSWSGPDSYQKWLCRTGLDSCDSPTSDLSIESPLCFQDFISAVW
ncbi:hypothetical protein RRG08_023498 [Elysia crispata]|uniref:Uncharacterized protein n=1 Tax=Elysia crispata TaxID=231223 RepID=A0AAE0YYE0_9GAST|nr:hypothetical protein RRG08_023498 [Elysia crispata]